MYTMRDWHEYKSIELHGEIIDVDINMIDLIKNLNKTKLITRGCCENWNNNNAYIIFEANAYNELLRNNKKFYDFIKSNNVIQSKIYYNLNAHRNIDYNCMEYENKYKNICEIWKSITFPTSSINELNNIVG
jgi:hypothetical protein